MTPVPEECESRQIPAATDDQGDTLYGCPDNHIPSSVLDFWQQYCYEKDLGCSIPYALRSAKFNAALSEYKHHLSEANKDRERAPSGLPGMR